ncbi:MAG: hypothetical protein GC189_03230 [Alphaproteobacteria bacterium]|nr:hypothetical protein [Alphaproteobacteria bacterium]
MILVGMIVIFLMALAGIALFSVLALRFAGPAVSRANTGQRRALAGLAVASCIGGVIGSAAGGFWGIGWVLYLAQP